MVPLTASAARITLVAMTDDAQQTPAVVAPHKKVGLLPPYAAGKPPVAVPGLHPYKLSSNENPYAPVSGVIDRVRQVVTGPEGAPSTLCRYPDTLSTGLRQALARELLVENLDELDAQGVLDALHCRLIELAAEGRSTVLLIDADLRRPTQAKNFDFPVGTPGLANLIANTAKLEDCLREVNDISMLCAGTVPPNPLELLSSQRFAKAIEYLKSKYDRIIIDSPPTQAVSDAMVLSTFANALIYVIKSDSTAIPLVEKGIGQLLQNNAPVTGIVLNQVDVKKAQKYGYSYGGYYDYYGYSGKSA